MPEVSGGKRGVMDAADVWVLGLSVLRMIGNGAAAMAAEGMRE